MKSRLLSFVAGVAAALLLVALPVTALASDGSLTLTIHPIKVLVNGQVFQPKDVQGNDVLLIPLTPDDREQFILDNQEAFNYGALEEFGHRDDHFEEEGEIISRETIETSIDSGEAYRIMQDGQPVGGVVIEGPLSHGVIRQGSHDLRRQCLTGGKVYYLHRSAVHGVAKQQNVEIRSLGVLIDTALREVIAAEGLYVD